jgi:hypothetical protein
MMKWAGRVLCTEKMANSDKFVTGIVKSVNMRNRFVSHRYYAAICRHEHGN